MAQGAEQPEPRPHPDLRADDRRRSTSHVVDHETAAEIGFTREAVEELLARDTFFWVDVARPTEDDFAVLRDVFKFHPLAVEDSEHFNQRAKVDDYDDARGAYAPLTRVFEQLALARGAAVRW